MTNRQGTTLIAEPPELRFGVHEAWLLACDAHAGQVDKLGRDYLQAHLIPIAESLAEHGDLAQSAGFLHDIIEDTPHTTESLLELGVPPAVVAAVDAVTRRPGEEYDAMIARAGAHPLGRLVKLADNAHNLAANAELAQRDPEQAERLRAKYERAREVLLAAEPQFPFVRGTCPSCGSADVFHILGGFPSGDDPWWPGPDWFEWVGCCVPMYRRRCDNCDAKWNVDETGQPYFDNLGDLYVFSEETDPDGLGRWISEEFELDAAAIVNEDGELVVGFDCFYVLLEFPMTHAEFWQTLVDQEEQTIERMEDDEEW